MNKLDIDRDKRIFLNKGIVMTLALCKNNEQYIIVYNLFKDDINHGFKTDAFARATKLQLKEFLLQLYYNDKIITL
jgi:hypothetical protein